MSRIDLMVLLDLVGASNPKFLTYINPQTSECDSYGQELSRIEDSLLKQMSQNNDQKYFYDLCFKEDDIVDDHMPLRERGLRHALHIISDPFPETWHTIEDDLEHLDKEAIVRINRIVRIFIAEYFNIHF